MGDDLIEFVDLDLDVERNNDGPVAIVDRDEFDERRLSMNYPDPVAQQALRTATLVEQLMVRRQGPFDGAWRRWLKLASPSDL
ncbi:MAG: hypothetical protein M3Y77_08790 [Actinomycetota bacterium]|nr:hypothetical protein [Actinomycetota bacterium]